MEPLLDPCNDRVMKNVKAPPHRPLNPQLMYPNPGMHTLVYLFCSYLINSIAN